ncbi:MAG: signal transduction histidine kinase [Clostridiaceae bacterium]|jgi:signal transduction histidine kinase|nr:signal transduction histidine kinase [Clostridiaceae bacterium]
MENYVLLNKSIILIYALIFYANGYNGKPVLNVILILIYCSLNIMEHLILNTKISKIICIADLILVAFSAAYINPIFYLFIPFCLYDMFQDKFPLLILLINIIISAFTKDFQIRSSIILIAGEGCILYYYGYKIMEKIDFLTESNDELKSKNYLLYEKLNKDESYENQIRYTSELEVKNKIAQEIHDKIGHTIAGSIMQLEASKIIMKKDEKKAEAMMENVINVLRQGMENIRATLTNLKPTSEQLGLNRLKLLLEEFSSNSNIESRIIYSDDMDKINYLIWKIIIDSVKEALTNTIKYSKATMVMVNIKALNKLLRIEIKDNGKGSSNIKKGLGITGIEERCEAYGGKVIVDGNNGFSIILLLPIK